MSYVSRLDAGLKWLEIKNRHIFQRIVIGRAFSWSIEVGNGSSSTCESETEQDEMAADPATQTDE